jgi:hypothetical protein
MVFEADKLKAVERVRRSMESSSGDSPYQFKRKRGIHRALDRKDPKITAMFDHELALSHLINTLNVDMFTACAYLPLMKGLTVFV